MSKSKNCDAAQTAAGQISGLVLRMLKIRDEESVAPEEFHILFTEDGDKHLRTMIAGLKTGHVAMTNAIDCDADPFIPNGWEVEEHRRGGMFEWNPDYIRLYLSNKQKNASIGGHKLRKELVADQPVLNANVLDYLLANKHLIPEEWKGKHVFFWGTIYRNSDGNLCVRCLCWCDSEWHWHGLWLDSVWRDVNPAVVRAS